MTTYRAVAAATAAFAQRIRQSIAPLEGAIVTTERPSAPVVGGPPRVNLFLYHTDANPFTTTDDLPTRRDDGTLIQRPRIALDLYYLLSFYGDDKLTALEPHQLLGLTMNGLHARPIITAEEFSAVDETLVGADYIALTPLPLNIHELSRLWSMFVQVPYTLSISLKASAALLVSDLPAGPALPVERRGFEVVTFALPHVASVQPAPGGDAFIPDAEVLVVGTGFGGDGATVQVGGADIALAPGAVSPERIVFRLSAPALAAGRQSLLVTNAAGLRAPAVPIDVRPVVTSLVLEAGTLAAQVLPPLPAGGAEDLKIVLDLVSPAPPGVQTTFTLAAQAEAPDQLRATLSGLPAGRYAVRVEIGGALSLLGRDDAGRQSPAVDVPPR